MHPEVVSEEAGSCPKCGMKLLATAASGYVCPMHPDVVSDNADHCPKCGMKLLPAVRRSRRRQVTATMRTTATDMSRPRRAATASMLSTATTVTTRTATLAGSSGKTTWSTSTGSRRRRTCTGASSTASTGAVNHAIDWHFKVGDQVKMRLVNEMDSDHPMHHPFHIHGAGRFLVMSRDDTVEENLVWKDTVLVRTGETVDILLDVTNPGHLDGALPHRRASRERNDVQLQRGASERRLNRHSVFARTPCERDHPGYLRRLRPRPGWDECRGRVPRAGEALNAVCRSQLGRVARD